MTSPSKLKYVNNNRLKGASGPIFLLGTLIIAIAIIFHYEISLLSISLNTKNTRDKKKEGSNNTTAIQHFNGKKKYSSSSAESGRTSLNVLGAPPSVDHPIWENATDEHEAVYLLANGVWRDPVKLVDDGDKFDTSSLGYVLNDEEINFLKWADHVTSNMTVEQASKRVAYGLWSEPYTSLYNTSTLPVKKGGEYFCRLSWGFHWCSPLTHGFDYHGRFWSTARGIEILESFVRLSDDGRTNPSIIFMGDSVLMETWQAGICSLARAGVTFLNTCPDTIGVPRYVSSMLRDLVCFAHPRINGIGVLAAFSDQKFKREKWRHVIFACTNATSCIESKEGNQTFHWDVIAPNLGVHYNFRDNDTKSQRERTRYREDLGELITYLSEHAKAQYRMNVTFPTLHMFWGSSPQHFSGSYDGLFHGLQKSKGGGCTAIHPTTKAYRSNRRRTDVVWNVMIQKLLENKTDCVVDDIVLDDPSSAQTKATLQTPCIAHLVDTCKGGITHLEVEPFLTQRSDAHPGSRCRYAHPAQLAKDPTGENCDMNKNYNTDCTHHCWSPLLFQSIWERLEIAVKYHVSRCQARSEDGLDS